MKQYIPLFLILIFGCCSQRDSEPERVYAGKVSLRTPLREFTATKEGTAEEINLTKTGSHELTFNLNGNISHLDYEEDVIIIRVEKENREWRAKKVKEGFELEDGTRLEYQECKGWELCLVDAKTREPILKGAYSLSGSNAKITLWISDAEKHVELLGLMANGLINKSRDLHSSNESSLTTVAAPVWAN